MKINPHSHYSQYGAPVLDSAGQTAALTLAQDAETQQQNARMIRHAAQQREIDHLERAAAKLHDMADQARLSGVWQAASGGLSASCQLAGAFLTEPAGRASRALAGGTKALDATANVDPFKIASQQLQAEKADSDTEARAASIAAQNAGETEQTARRRVQKADDLRQQLLRIEHEARRAALGR